VNEDRRPPIVEFQLRVHRQRVTWHVAFRFVARWLLRFAALWLVFTLLRRTGSSLAPFAIGLLLAYLLLPIVAWLDHWMPRWASILAVYLAALCLLTLGLNFILPPAIDQTSQFVQSVPAWIERSEAFMNERIAAFQRVAPAEVQAWINRMAANLEVTLERNATTYVQQLGTLVFNSAVTLLQTLTFVIGFLVIPIFLFFVLLSTPRLPRTIHRFMHPAIRADVWNIWRIVDRIFGRYVRSQLMLGLIVGVATFLGLWSLRLLGINVPYPLLLAIIAGIGELIPVIGPILSAIPALIVVSGSGWGAILAIVVLYTVIQQVESQILVPRIVGGTLRLNPAVLLLLLVVAAAAGGLLLVILAPPLVAICRDLYVYGQRRLREPPVSPAAAVADLLVEAKSSHRAMRSLPVSNQ